MALKIIPKLLWHRGKLSKFFMALRKFVLFIFLFRLENLTAAGNWKEYSWTDSVIKKAAEGFSGQHGDYYCPWGAMGTRKCYADRPMNIGSSPSRHGSVTT
jgi:hypothetical protein